MLEVTETDAEVAITFETTADLVSSWQCSTRAEAKDRMAMPDRERHMQRDSLVGLEEAHDPAAGHRIAVPRTAPLNRQQPPPGVGRSGMLGSSISMWT